MTGERFITVPTMSSGFAIIWGLYALNPYSSLFTKNPAIYGRMQTVANEWFWGSLMVIAGLSALVFYFRGYYKTEAGLLGATFTIFAVLYAFADLSSPASGLYGFIALCNYGMLWARIWRR